jgi:glutamate formiminotransferase/formiminotetrahydrofolate cyclodeaminase
VDGQAQVSMNLVDTEKTPVYRAFEMVKREAEAHGVSPTWSEVIGLIPEKALFDTAARHLQLRGFSSDIVLEHKVRRAVSGGESLSGFVASVASSAPVPGGGSVAAHVGSLGAALAQMVSGLTVGRKKYAAVDAEMKALALEAVALNNQLSRLVADDAAAYAFVSDAYKLPKDSPEQQAARDAAIEKALVKAAETPLDTAVACARVAELAATCAEKGNTNAASDAGVSALLAEAACRGAVYNVRINVAAMKDKAVGKPLVDKAMAALARAHASSKLATDAVERHL